MFESAFARIVAEPRWVFDSYGYDQVRDAMWAAAATVVWLDNRPRRDYLAERTQRAAPQVATVRLRTPGEFDRWFARQSSPVRIPSTTVEDVHPRDIPTISIDEIPADAVLLDVREDDEWAAGHIDGAVHIPMNEVPQRLSFAPGPVTPEATVVVTCKVGGRSAQVTAWLRQQGYQAVNLAGGMLAWEAAGRPMQADGGGPAQVV